jgi:hypothetical protein
MGKINIGMQNKTKSKGVYIIAGIEMGKEYWVFCYPPQDSDYALDLTPRKIKVTTQYPRADFELEIGGSISGTVYEADGVTPVKDVDVVAVSENSGFGYGITDQNGGYLIQKLKPYDSYYVLVAKKGCTISLKKDIRVTSNIVTPNIDAVLSFPSTTSSSIKVKSITTGEYIKDALVIIYKEGESGFNYTNVNGDTKIEGVTGGSYNISIFAPGFEYYSISNVEITSGEVNNFTFEMNPSSLQGFNYMKNKFSMFSIDKFRFLLSENVFAQNTTCPPGYEFCCKWGCVKIDSGCPPDKCGKEELECRKKADEKYNRCKTTVGIVGGICGVVAGIIAGALLIEVPAGAVAAAIIIGVGFWDICKSILMIQCELEAAVDKKKCEEKWYECYLGQLEK